MIYEIHELPEINSGLDVRVTAYADISSFKEGFERDQFNWMVASGVDVSQVGRTIYHLRRANPPRPQ